eukprot:CAMPEP_0172538260 /NCGR_PEP_ID=MMETSP1067-20121228/9679_1 /TAXON_ID=265564 ORGANISM="Thalassiosira punctigera, Strain Tpunct2005C2" /NCGR_SAMPLE_ID=MMETSP1067 /ASSEMBLY_ACC=CAM_ASM_000444 /LENGTH=972 /DNA_ID=CAMNT_0013323721 /DNA_START=179 /DNA_END=3097 /DNA_ORIENTATION=+
MNSNGEEVELTLSKDDGNATQPPHPVTPVKYESGYPQSTTAAAANNTTGEDAVEGLQPATTGGKGLWSLWTRNFKSPLLMLLDLVDNAVDAAVQQEEDNEFTGQVQIYRDLYEVMPGQTYTTGLCIQNNAKEIAPLKEVLQLFISAKVNSGSDSIGENGVGLKQSCAALSDLSFVLVKNGTNKFELGIIAKAMQKKDGVFLPCFEFKGGNSGTSIGQQMLDMFTKPIYKNVAECVAEYGKVRSGGNPSLARGVARLSKHFEDMNKKFSGNPCVFEVIIDKVDKKVAVRDIINELQHEIPRRYLHLKESFKFCVGKKELTFKYWPERLVEFTKVDIPVRSKIPWSEDFGEMTPDSYHVGVFLGFDRYRIADPESGFKRHKECSLYVYSRACGRMIQYESDARTTLGLVAGGTEFCQALTVIIDDKEGHLPLDPTKQGIAFGNQVHGHVHKENLYAVVSCVVKFYYRHHMNKFGGKKSTLTAKIREFCSSEVPENLKTCGNSELTDYGVRFIQTKHDRIQVDRTFTIGVIDGPDTIFRLFSEAAKGKAPSKKVSRRTPSCTKKRQVAKADKTALPDDQNDCKATNHEASDDRVSKAARRPAQKKKQRAKVRRLPLPDAKRGGKSAKGKIPNDKVCERAQSPPQKKQQVAKVSKSLAKKKQKGAKVSSPKRKADSYWGDKRQCTAKTIQLPVKIRGMRSSPRQSIGKPPKRYCHLSDSESGDEDDNNSTTTMDNSKIKSEPIGGGHDEDPIDLCSSSDEDEVMNEVALASENESEDVATDSIRVKVKNSADEVEGMNANAPPTANNLPNLSASEIEVNDASEEAAADSNMVKIENTADGEDQPMSEDNFESESIAPKSVAFESEVNDSIEEVAEKFVDEEDSRASANTSLRSLANYSEMRDAAEDVTSDSNAMKIENIMLKSENADLKAKVAVLSSENDSLEKEIKTLRIELEQSKRMVYVIKRRSNPAYGNGPM